MTFSILSMLCLISLGTSSSYSFNSSEESLNEKLFSYLSFSEMDSGLILDLCFS